jgi:exopolyphosphatase/guanosine-5'-triphosphate,3'-diphosphate pyrophosphatase
VKTFAAIDIGTNSVLMSITRATDAGEFVPVSDRATITRLGHGVDASGRLDDAAIERTLATLAEYAREAHAHSARIAAVGTSALRDAQNAARFLDEARRVLGAPVEVIAGAREAELSFAGALADLSVDASRVTVIDIGGGSTELVRRSANGSLDAESLDIGAVRLHERHRVSIPAARGELAAVRADAMRALSASRVQPQSPLVAVAGTATTLAAIAGAVEPYEHARIHGSVLTRDEIDRQCARLAALSLAERTQVAGLAAARADVIVVGALILSSVCEHAGADRVIVSDGGVRVGLTLEMLREVHD